MSQTVRLCVNLDRDDYEALDNIAKRYERTVESLVEWAVRLAILYSHFTSAPRFRI